MIFSYTSLNRLRYHYTIQPTQKLSCWCVVYSASLTITYATVELNVRKYLNTVNQSTFHISSAIILLKHL